MRSSVRIHRRPTVLTVGIASSEDRLLTKKKTPFRI